MADLDEALWQHVEEEPSQKLVGREGNGVAATSAEGDAAGVERNEAAVGKSDAMSVAAQVAENVLWSAEGRFGVDDPALSLKLVAEMLELSWSRQAQVAARMSLPQTREKLASKECPQHTDRKQEVFASPDPTLAIGGLTHCGYPPGKLEEFVQVMFHEAVHVAYDAQISRFSVVETNGGSPARLGETLATYAEAALGYSPIYRNIAAPMRNIWRAY